MWNNNLMQQGNLIDKFLARRVSDIYIYPSSAALMLRFSIWLSAPSFWMGGCLESRCIGRVYGADGAVPRTAPSAL